MPTAKDIRIKPIKAAAANAIVKRTHYSGKVVPNSKLHFGVFLGRELCGALQFGCPIDKRGAIKIVDGTLWHEMLELNRMAFNDKLPRCSESRAISVCFRLIKKHYPHIKWVQSFSDATTCGDGIIYRASGFKLIRVERNKTQLRLPDGTVVAKKTLDNHPVKNTKYWSARGAVPLDGFQIKYIYFLDKSCQKKLMVPVLPFSAIEDAGAGMYRGEKVSRAKLGDDCDQQHSGGATPTCTLQTAEAS